MGSPRWKHALLDPLAALIRHGSRSHDHLAWEGDTPGRGTRHSPMEKLVRPQKQPE